MSATPEIVTEFRDSALREAAKKNCFLSGPATKRGRGVRGVPLREKKNFLNIFVYLSPKIVEIFFGQNPFPKKKFLWPLSRE